MRVWHSLDEVPADLGRTVVVIGNFDGVHLGHQHVIGRARERADAEDLRVVAVTFDPHPMSVLRPDHAPQTLTDLATRARLLQDARRHQMAAEVPELDAERYGIKRQRDAKADIEGHEQPAGGQDNALDEDFQPLHGTLQLSVLLR